jgi:hypothetical protein
MPTLVERTDHDDDRSTRIRTEYPRLVVREDDRRQPSNGAVAKFLAEDHAELQTHDITLEPGLMSGEGDWLLYELYPEAN